MVGKRRYDDRCAVAHGLDLVGERWALLVVRDLLLGPKRFTDLRTGMPGASPDVLTQRLRELQAAGIVQRRKLAPPAGSWVYELTAWGSELEPIVTALGRWSSRSRSMPSGAPISVDSLMLSLRALFDPAAADGFAATVGLRLGEDRFRVRIEDGRIDVTRDDAVDADVTVDTDPAVLTALLHEGRRPAEAERSGELRLDGDRATARRFLKLFPLPEPAGPAADPE
ncbi:winged helix-turn-helix transcriptional regulator [Microlunatus parietis]|uniref:DNA-binding HxlR family transcriptional regulator/putative sterol carrier protein n=1 Tax=Microlunatus parietis TaxID=682979 RepID=A0A7Y9ICA2_9ACTN|nr:winged helix-turn-helix transcriptional regulator [Microlunatus parietis]NYE73654.1 DNA-binding HxlR family transcriptional regulator/putative sterol carrier protein [Microlunatus parietis]